MKTKVTPQLRQEAKRYQFQFTCQHCAYFEPIHSACSEGYPNHEHLDVELLAEQVLFCKLFEGA